MLAARTLTSSDIWSQLTRRNPRWRPAIQNGVGLDGADASCRRLAIRPPSDVPRWKWRLPRAFEAAPGSTTTSRAVLDAADHHHRWPRHSLLCGHRQAYGLSVSPNPLTRTRLTPRSRTRISSYATAPSSTSSGIPSAARSRSFSDRLHVRHQIQRHRCSFGDSSSQRRKRIDNRPASDHHLRVAPMRKFLCWLPR